MLAQSDSEGTQTLFLLLAQSECEGLDQAWRRLLDLQFLKELWYIVNRFAIRYGFADIADDIFQDTCIELFRAMKEGRYNPEMQLGGYAYGIARNIAIDELRRRKRLKGRCVSLEDLQEWKDIPGITYSTAGKAELEVDLESACQKMNEKERKAFLLSERDGLTGEEIAQEMDITPGYARQLVHRGKLKAQEFMGK